MSEGSGDKKPVSGASELDSRHNKVVWVAWWPENSLGCVGLDARSGEASSVGDSNSGGELCNVAA